MRHTTKPFRRGIAALILVPAVLLGVLIGPVTAASPYVKDVYFSAGYERQIDGRTCVAGSTAMMLNFIARRDLRLDQMGILRYAQANDALRDSVQRGSDPLGWARALTRFSDRTGQTFGYRWEAHTSELGALKRAATSIATTNKPVGLTVAHGTHAVVMTGFEASRDPRRGSFTLLASGSVTRSPTRTSDTRRARARSTSTSSSMRPRRTTPPGIDATSSWSRRTGSPSAAVDHGPAAASDRVAVARRAGGRHRTDHGPVRDLIVSA